MDNSNSKSHLRFAVRQAQATGAPATFKKDGKTVTLEMPGKNIVLTLPVDANHLGWLLREFCRVNGILGIERTAYFSLGEVMLTVAYNRKTQSRRFFLSFDGNAPIAKGRIPDDVL